MKNPVRGLVKVLAASVLLLGLGLGTMGCRPDFPNCRDDDDCRAALDDGDNPQRLLFCVNGQCQGCRGDSDCPPGVTCKNFMCQPECRSDSECTGGLVCRNNKCVAECARRIPARRCWSTRAVNFAPSTKRPFFRCPICNSSDPSRCVSST